MKQKTKIFLFAWILILILPMVWVVRINPRLDLWFNTFFAPEWMHIVAHILLFIVVGFLVPWVLFDQSPIKTTLKNTVWVVLGIGLIQEVFQLVVKQRGFGRNEVFDLLIDLIASLTGFFLYWIFFRKISARK
ncbi:MAG: hypothetical protein CL609_14085 [Anaerolineaceae bacterium]|nr:hypothetical protein [Anaerolineaceae bacterium]